MPRKSSPAPSTPTVSSNASSQAPKRWRVKSATGQLLDLQIEREAKFYTQARDKYLSENSFTVASDLRALDRLLLYEVQVYRYQWQLAAGMDYDGCPLDAADEIQRGRAIKEAQSHISQIQAELGLTRASREKDQDSVGSYIRDLQVRAKAHGVRREKQLGKALELMNEALSICGAYRRSNERERRELGWESAEEIVAWFDEVARPQYDAVDEHFRKHEQRFWIRDMAK